MTIFLIWILDIPCWTLDIHIPRWKLDILLPLIWILGIQVMTKLGTGK